MKEEGLKRQEEANKLKADEAARKEYEEVESREAEAEAEAEDDKNKEGEGEGKKEDDKPKGYKPPLGSGPASVLSLLDGLDPDKLAKSISDDDVKQAIASLPQPIKIKLDDRLEHTGKFNTLNSAFFKQLSKKLSLRVFSGAVVRFAQQGQLDTQGDAVAEANAAVESAEGPTEGSSPSGSTSGSGDSSSVGDSSGAESSDASSTAEGDGASDLDEDEDDLAAQNERVSLLDIAEAHPGVHAYVEKQVTHDLTQEGDDSTKASDEFMRRGLLYLREEVAEAQNESFDNGAQAVYLQRTYDSGRNLIQEVATVQSKWKLDSAKTGKKLEVRYFEADKVTGRLAKSFPQEGTTPLNRIERNLEAECDGLNEKFSGLAHVLPGLLRTQVKSPEALLDLLEGDFGGVVYAERRGSSGGEPNENESVFSASKERVLRAMRAILHGVRERRAVLGRAVDGYLQGVAEPLFAAEIVEAADPTIPMAGQKSEHRLAREVKVVTPDGSASENHVMVKEQSWEKMKSHEREEQVRALQSMPFAIYVRDEDDEAAEPTPIFVSGPLPEQGQGQGRVRADAANPFKTSGAGKMRATRQASYLKSCRRAQFGLRRIEEAVGHHHVRLMMREARVAAAFLGSEVRQFQEQGGPGAAAVLANLGKTVRRSLQTAFSVFRVLLKNSWMSEEVYEKKYSDGREKEVRILTSTTAESAELKIDKLCRLFRKLAVWLQWTAAIRRRESAIDQMPDVGKLSEQAQQTKMINDYTPTSTGDIAEQERSRSEKQNMLTEHFADVQKTNYGDSGLVGSGSARPTSFRGEPYGAAAAMHQKSLFQAQEQRFMKKA